MTTNTIPVGVAFADPVITSGTIDGAAIGATTRSTGAFTTLAANAAVSFTSTLAVTGAITATGGVVGTVTGTPIVASATVAATGSDQAGAAAITTGFTLVTAANNAKGVKLPTAAAGLVCFVKNGDAANDILLVYPFSGDGINAVAVNSAYNMAAKTACIFVAYDATTWYTFPLVAS